jgi:hypothetical protein
MCYMAAIPIALAAVQTVQGIQTQRAQASAERERADLADQEARQRADAIRARAQSQLGSARVALARSGVTPEGSPADVLASTAANDELEAQLAGWRGSLRSFARPAAGGLGSVLPAATRAIGSFGNLWS